jgi:hypothetical protein
LIPLHARLLAPEPDESPAPPGARGAEITCLARSVRERTCDAQAAQPVLSDGGGLVEQSRFAADGTEEPTLWLPGADAFHPLDCVDAQVAQHRR